MAKIDGQMNKMFESYTNASSDQGGKVSDQEAARLITRAEQVNNSGASSFRNRKKTAGKQSLKALFDKDPAAFTPESKKAIENYLRYGQLPTASARPEANYGRTSFSRSNPNIRTGFAPNFPPSPSQPNGAVPPAPTTPPVTVPTAPSDTATGGRRRHRRHAGSNGSGAARPSDLLPSSVSVASTTVPTSGRTAPSPVAPASVAPAPTSPPAPARIPPAPTSPPAPARVPPVPTSPPAPARVPPAPTSPAAPAVRPSIASTVVTPANVRVGGGVGTEGPYGTMFIDWKSPKEAWECHWWPQQESVAGGDPNNNLYAVSGPLDKYDQLTGKKAREYEYKHNRLAKETGNAYRWWGHCNHATEVVSVLPEPKHPVTKKLPNGKTVTFSELDIQGLLVKVSPGLIARVDFKGNRFNDSRRDDPNDPAPDVFFDTLDQWTKEDLLITLDLDRTEQVWNFVYDKVKAWKSTKPPEGFNASGLPTDGSVTYYRAEMEGTGYPDKKRLYLGYVQRNDRNEVVAKSWIKTDKSHLNPDFMWRAHPVGDVMNKANWKQTKTPSNPEVDPQIVYDIYMESLA